MKERPILFNAEMVKAILAGKKTQTRRLVKPQPAPLPGTPGHAIVDLSDGNATDHWGWLYGDEPNTCHVESMRCPFGKPGSLLCIKEAFRFPARVDNHSPTWVGNESVVRGHAEPWSPIHYEADGHRVDWTDEAGEPGRLRDVLYMPHWASRLSLLVTDVRVERLQDISGDDIVAEGIDGDFPPLLRGNILHAKFAELWESVYGKRATWASNPWLWVVSFKVVS